MRVPDLRASARGVVSQIILGMSGFDDEGGANVASINSQNIQNSDL